MAHVRLIAFGREIPALKDGFLQNADPMLSNVSVRCIVQHPIGVLTPQDEARKIQVAHFRKDYTASTKHEYVFVLVAGPPKGWEWVIHGGYIRARRTEPPNSLCGTSAAE